MVGLILSTFWSPSELRGEDVETSNGFDCGVAMSFALTGVSAKADDENHDHDRGGINHFLHDNSIPHSHGDEGDAHEYNHYP